MNQSWTLESLEARTCARLTVPESHFSPSGDSAPRLCYLTNIFMLQMARQSHLNFSGSNTTLSMHLLSKWIWFTLSKEVFGSRCQVTHVKKKLWKFMCSHWCFSFLVLWLKGTIHIWTSIRFGVMPAAATHSCASKYQTKVCSIVGNFCGKFALFVVLLSHNLPFLLPGNGRLPRPALYHAMHFHVLLFY